MNWPYSMGCCFILCLPPPEQYLEKINHVTVCMLFQALKNRTNKIFVGGVPVDMPEETIRKYFVQFGEVSMKAHLSAS